jgi:integrase/recombinase XerD
MTDIIYNGPFGKYIKDHIDLKQAIGYKYIIEAKLLKKFDTFTIEKYSVPRQLTFLQIEQT